MIYIVVPHYIITDELEELATEALQSIRRTADVFIVSVDDGSPRDTSFLNDISDKVIHLTENSGFAKACNAGLQWALKQADAIFIGCANNDIQVFDGWLEALVEPYDKFEDVGITGLVASKDKQEAKQNKGRKITSGGLLNGHMQSGGLWLMPVSVLKEVGLFDEQFEVGGEEDTDLFMRIKYAGYLLVMSDKSCFWHKEGATRWNEEIPGFKDKNKEIEQGNYDRFAAKWGYDIRTRGLKLTEEILED